MVADKTLDLCTCYAVSSAAEVIEGTSKETIFICSAELFVPESVRVKDILEINVSFTVSKNFSSRGNDIRIPRVRTLL